MNVLRGLLSALFLWVVLKIFFILVKFFFILSSYKFKITKQNITDKKN